MLYEIIEGIPNHSTLFELVKLKEASFSNPNYPFVKLKNELESKMNIITIVAKDNEKFVGYKIGHERNLAQFYSWLGGVRSDYQGNGIAKELMKKQHELLKKKVMNEYLRKLEMNLKIC